ncbi:MAG: hypothetical protein ACTS7D_01290, partial [Candidatus Hodgkinia cicadicola]
SPIMIGNGKVASFCGRQIWGERLDQLRDCAGALESWEASTGDERARRGRKRIAMWTKVENDITKLHFGEVIKTNNEGLRWWFVQRKLPSSEVKTEELGFNTAVGGRSNVVARFIKSSGTKVKGFLRNFP